MKAKNLSKPAIIALIVHTVARMLGNVEAFELTSAQGWNQVTKTELARLFTYETKKRGSVFVNPSLIRDAFIEGTPIQYIENYTRRIYVLNAYGKPVEVSHLRKKISSHSYDEIQARASKNFRNNKRGLGLFEPSDIQGVHYRRNPDNPDCLMCVYDSWEEENAYAEVYVPNYKMLNFKVPESFVIPEDEKNIEAVDEYARERYGIGLA